MIIRRPLLDEFSVLRKLHQQLEVQFPFPDLTFASSIYVIEHEDKIIAFGTLVPIFESTVVLDNNQSKELRLEALQLLVNRAEFELKSQGITQYHAFVQVKSFYNLLKKRFGFKTTKGNALVKVIS